MFANRPIIAIGLACVGILFFTFGAGRELQDDAARARVEASVQATSDKPSYGQRGKGPTALAKPTLASLPQVDASVLANPEVMALIDDLRQHGIVLENPEASQISFLYPVPGVAYRIDRGGLAIHPFPDRMAAEKRASEIPGELTRPSLGDWVDQPHFYRCQSALVLYLGRDARVLQALDDECGPPFIRPVSALRQRSWAGKYVASISMRRMMVVATGHSPLSVIQCKRFRSCPVGAPGSSLAIRPQLKIQTRLAAYLPRLTMAVPGPNTGLASSRSTGDIPGLTASSSPTRSMVG